MIAEPHFLLSARMTTKVGAIYEIVNRSNGDLLFAQEILSEGTVPFNYSLLGATRAVESWNRAVRNNIADFINLLEVADISNPVFLGEAEAGQPLDESGAAK